MKRLITITAIAVISLNFVSCRQDDETSEFGSNSVIQNKQSNRSAADTIKTDTVKAPQKSALVDPDPPYRDPTRW